MNRGAEIESLKANDAGARLTRLGILPKVSFVEAVCCLVICCSLLIGTKSNGQQTVPPKNVTQQTTGFTVRIAEGWVQSEAGYRPFRVTVETISQNPVTTDQQFNVAVKDRGYRGPDRTLMVPLIIPAGQSSTHVDAYIDSLTDVYFESELIVERGAGDGEFQPRRDLVRKSLHRYAEDSWNDRSLLLVSSKLTGRNETCWQCANARTTSLPSLQMTAGNGLPSIDKMIDVFIAPDNRSPTPTAITSLTGTNGKLHGCRPVDLPDAWIGLSSVEQMLISISDLKTVCRDQEKQQEIRKWVACGGTLIVFDTGPAFQHADGIAPLLIGIDNEEPNRPFKQSWREPAKDVIDLNRLISIRADRYWYYNVEEDVWVSRDDANVSDSKSWKVVPSAGEENIASKFLVSDFVNGRIAAVNDDMQGWQIQDWRGLLNALRIDRPSIEDRIGQDNAIEALPGFRVPGVGDPPVVAFQALIGMFIFIAGPIMFFVLKRTKRMQLLFVLVPLLSISACAGLLWYAVLVDGFDSWGRLHSVTRIDHRSQSAVTHARAAYYSGRRPEPYSYNLDTLVMNPLGNVDHHQLARQTPSFTAHSGGNIRPRTPHQFVTIRSYETDRQLVWLVPRGDDAQSDDNKQIRVRNNLGARILYATANIDSKFYAIENLADGEQSIAQARIKATLSNELSQQTSDDIKDIILRSDPGPDRGDEYEVIASLREHRGAELIDQPNTYIAIVEEFPPVAEQTEPVKYKKQLHVIIGNW